MFCFRHSSLFYVSLQCELQSTRNDRTWCSTVLSQQFAWTIIGLGIKNWTQDFMNATCWTFTCNHCTCESSLNKMWDVTRFCFVPPPISPGYNFTCSVYKYIVIYKVVQIWPGLFVCKEVTVYPGHIWTRLQVASFLLLSVCVWKSMCLFLITSSKYHIYKSHNRARGRIKSTVISAASCTSVSYPPPPRCQHY
jgi:hypothetical protein